MPFRNLWHYLPAHRDKSHREAGRPFIFRYRALGYSWDEYSALQRGGIAVEVQRDKGLLSPAMAEQLSHPTRHITRELPQEQDYATMPMPTETLAIWERNPLKEVAY